MRRGHQQKALTPSFYSFFVDFNIFLVFEILNYVHIGLLMMQFLKKKVLGFREED